MFQFDAYFIISQILMFIAIASDILSFQFKKRKSLIIFFIISASLISAHYFFLGRVAAGIIMIIAALRFLTCYFTTNKRFMYLFLVANILTLIFTYKDFYDIIVCIGSGTITVASFQINDKNIRRIMMFGTSLMLIYNILIFSPMGALSEAIFLTSNIIGYYRYYVRKTSCKAQTKKIH